MSVWLILCSSMQTLDAKCQKYWEWRDATQRQPIANALLLTHDIAAF